jgi:hypothetical protein
LGKKAQAVLTNCVTSPGQGRRRTGQSKKRNGGKKELAGLGTEFVKEKDQASAE